MGLFEVVCSQIFRMISKLLAQVGTFTGQRESVSSLGFPHVENVL